METILIIYKTGMYLVWAEARDTQINECSKFLNQDIEEMSDSRITEQLLLCQQYGFYPTVEFRL
jgi:hypothetical protein